MNQASFFIEKKALFGGYPSHNQIIELINEGVVWFVDLTNDNEKGIHLYSHLVNNWINYPIKDQGIPENKKNFLIFLFIIQMAIESLKPGEKLYLHCRGGHGRSSLVISCFLCLLFGVSPNESLNLIKNYHSLRPNLRSKWLTGWPLSLKQRKFVESFFGTLYFYSNFNDEKIKDVFTKTDFFRNMIILNLYLHQNPYILNTLLHSGFKTLKGEGIISTILQKLRFYILYSKAKKIFDND
ncbi:Putative tyrosine phosphatase [Invertebrate iridescent virus 22]|uniref:Putative tyrosine phosphatase n=1 Tax=Invertebrate iridescent virus 22 TaxID=345198 RepID=W8W2N8_9VIRU|nr:Putative tyrosine phosphatase [Invertebrate iridescent virus 22]CCV01864.1 Putative tyrosine phosphatase [Invertebrate iridescent virus 22]